jgi:hypothetical protein
MELEMQNPREQKIDEAICSACELLGALHKGGPINAAQTRLIIEAAVRAVVPNFAEFEIRDSAKRMHNELVETVQR